MSDERTVFVGNITERVSEEILYELFLQTGPLERVHIPKDKEGRRRQFAFITFKHEASVPYTLQLLNGLCLYGRPLKLNSRSSGKDGGSSPRGASPHGASPPVMSHSGHSPSFNPAPPSYGGQQGQLHRSNTWHGNPTGEEGGHYQRQRSGSPSPESSRHNQPDWSSRQGHRGQQNSRFSPQHGGQQGRFNQGSPMLPPANPQGMSFDMRRQRVLQQHQISIDAHRQPQQHYSQNSGNRPHWQSQPQRHGRY